MTDSDIPGTKKWRFEADGNVSRYPMTVDSTIYFRSDNNCIYALDALDGTKEWNFKSSEVIWSPTVADEAVYAGFGDSRVCALDAPDGTKEWAFETNGEVRSPPSISRRTC